MHTLPAIMPVAGSRANSSIELVDDVVVRYSERPSGGIATANASAVLTADWHPSVSDGMHPTCVSAPAGDRANTVSAFEKFDGAYAKRSSGLSTTVCGDCNALTAVQSLTATLDAGSTKHPVATGSCVSVPT